MVNGFNCCAHLCTCLKVCTSLQLHTPSQVCISVRAHTNTQLCLHRLTGMCGKARANAPTGPKGSRTEPSFLIFSISQRLCYPHSLPTLTLTKGSRFECTVPWNKILVSTFHYPHSLPTLTVPKGSRFERTVPWNITGSWGMMASRERICTFKTIMKVMIMHTHIVSLFICSLAGT